MMPRKENTSKGSLSTRGASVVRQRHTLLNDKYCSVPSSAWITDASEVIGTDLQDPFRTTVLINDKMKVPFRIGVHEAVGGDHDFPNPGDMLCASLASCFESTIRIISNKLGIKLLQTKIRTTDRIDVRGTLMIDKSVPVGFQSMHIEVIITAKNTNEKLLNTLIKGAKHSCIVHQTICKGVPITLNADIKIKN
ncbi:putative OsmC-like protein [Catalinimonas alkaloidigena]|uniref:OsmC family protein n=1 Tax=Catalinimonas alkaloidigena TaxID=1075417 RepID=UPI0024057FC0|nr:OsmC family protein [Catalinimonas alkaloidigena]MDF9800127.1 putative OsmC-like protein [Catalinimonas alkaloidigena]